MHSIQQAMSSEIHESHESLAGTTPDAVEARRAVMINIPGTVHRGRRRDGAVQEEGTSDFLDFDF